MNPFCPRCMKRVKARKGPACVECGTYFDAAISERLAPECGKCGGEEWRDEVFMIGGRAPLLCRHCDGRDGPATKLTPGGRPIKDEADMRQMDPPDCPHRMKPDPRDARIKELEGALQAIADPCKFATGGVCKKAILPCDECLRKFARAAMEKHL